MSPSTSPLVAAAGASFDLLLIAHVACALVGFGAVATTGVQAVRLARRAGTDPGASLRRYFAPGFNWAGRVLYGVPAFGFALLADSGGHLDLGEPWVLAGLGLWALSMLVAEVLIWPAEHRIQVALGGPELPGGVPSGLRRDCLLVGVGAAGLVGAFVVATVLMVAKPG